MKKLFLYFMLIACLSVMSAQSGEEVSGPDFIPLAYAHSFSFEEQSLYGYGGGMILMQGDFEPLEGADRDNLQIVALYTRHSLKEEPLLDYPGDFNSIDFLIQKKKKRHQSFSLLKSYADKPVTGGRGSFDFVTGYGYEIISGRTHSLWLGGSLVVSDCDMELPGGIASPVIPFPFLHYDFSSPLVDASFDITTSPMLDFVLAPRSRWHLNGSMIITDMAELQDKGMKYDLSLEYRFFEEDHPIGDFAGVKLGYMAEDYEYSVSSSEESSLQIAWQSVYATLDLSLIEITAGYIPGGEACYQSGQDQDLGSGYFCRLQLAYLF